MIFWSWARAEDDASRAVLVIDAPIDSGVDWYADAVTPARLREELAQRAGQEIFVEINSPGGDIFAGFEIYNLLRAHVGGVTVRVVGQAASAASVVAMAASPGRLLMSHASMMMIHQPWTGVAGNQDDLREQAEILDMITDVMVDVYMRRATCGEAEIRRMLAEETYLTPQRAREIGLCDEIDGEAAEPIAAQMRGRYAAMSRAQAAAIMARMGVAPREAQPQPPQTAQDTLEQVDALLRAIGL